MNRYIFFYKTVTDRVNNYNARQKIVTTYGANETPTDLKNIFLASLSDFERNTLVAHHHFQIESGKSPFDYQAQI